MENPANLGAIAFRKIVENWSLQLICIAFENLKTENGCGS